MLYSGGSNLRFTIIILITLLACISLGGQVATASYKIPMIVVASIFMLMLSFLSTRLALGLMIFSMLLSPEIVLGNLPRRDIVVRIEDLMIAVLGVYWLTRLAIDKRLQVFSGSPLNMLIVLYMMAALFSTARGIIVETIPPLQATFYVIKYFQYFFIYFIVLNLIRDRRHISFFLKAFLLTFVIVNGYAIFTKFTNPELIRTTAPFEGEIGEPNTLGGYQVLLLGVIIGLITHVKSLRYKLALGVTALTAVYPFLQTLSRASYVAIIPMYLTFIVFHRKKRLQLIGVLLIIIALGAVLIPENVIERIEYTFVAYEQKAVEPVEMFGITFGPSSSARIRSWMLAYGTWLKSPYLGFGVTGYGFLDSQYFRVLLELGVVGFFIFGVLLISISRQTLRVYRYTSDPLLKGLALGFLAGHVGIMFHALTANTYILIRIMEPYWFLAAMVMSIPRLENMERDKLRVDGEPEPIPSGYFRNATHLLKNA